MGMIDDDLIELVRFARPDQTPLISQHWATMVALRRRNFTRKETSRAYADSNPVFVYISIWPTSGGRSAPVDRAPAERLEEFVGDLSIINGMLSLHSIDQVFTAQVESERPVACKAQPSLIRKLFMADFIFFHAQCSKRFYGFAKQTLSSLPKKNPTANSRNFVDEKKVKIMLTHGPIHPARHPETEQFPFLSDITPDTISDPVLSFQVVSQKGVEFIVAICGNIR